MSRAGLALALLCAIATSGAAQAPKSIDPGMSETKVVERLGQPDLSRASGDFKYLFYHNNCGKQCGMDDVVILQKDSVVDAMFRSPERSYSGKSSSPRAISAEVASRTRAGTHDVPSGEVVQAGAPKATDTTAAAPKTVDSTSAKPAAPKPAAHKSPKTKAVHPDSARHDTITGTLRIPVKPPLMSTKRADSTHADSAAKRPPNN